MSTPAQPYRVERALLVSVDKIEPNPWNPNQMSPLVRKAQSESLYEFGYIDNCLVRPHPGKEGFYQILDGEHRYRDCVEKGYQELHVDVLHGISDAQAKRLTILMNETKGNPDQKKLAQLIAEIQLDVPDLEDLRKGLAFETSQLNAMVAGLNSSVSGLQLNLEAPPLPSINPQRETPSEPPPEPPPAAPSVRMFNIFLTSETFPEFQLHLDGLMEAWALQNSSVTIQKALEFAFAEIVGDVAGDDLE